MSAATEQILNFDHTLMPGNVKAAMREAGASSRDLWQMDIDKLRVLPNFNVRTKNDAYKARVRKYANSMKAEGYYQSKPMAGYVAKENDELIVFITDGHCRFDAVKLAISEGAEIAKIPVVVSPQGTNMDDLDVELVKGNDGCPLSPFELAIVCKRRSRNGWDLAQIANRLDFTEQYVEGLLLLMSAPKEIRDMVETDQVSASNAIAELRKHGDKAALRLQHALAQAKDKGAKKVTARGRASRCSCGNLGDQYHRTRRHRLERSDSHACDRKPSRTGFRAAGELLL